MSQSELVKRIVQVLDCEGIPYMLTGSTVSSLQGEPRSTHDLDVVVAIQPGDVPGLVLAFPSPGYYLDETEAREAIENQSSFNLIDMEAGEKVDFWVLTQEPFDASRFARRYAERIFEMDIQVSRPEDTILMKLRWATLSGGSEKQFTDALRVFEVQRERLDMDYMRHWAQELGVDELLERMVKEAQ